MIGNGTNSYIQRFQDRLNSITDPRPQQNILPQPGQLPGNASTGYSLNNNYAVGNRTYNGFSPSPQVGAGSVNPAGYNLRDTQAAVKNNLLSQQLGG